MIFILAPHLCLPSDKRLFDPAKALDPNDPDYKKATASPSILRDGEAGEASGDERR